MTINYFIAPIPIWQFTDNTGIFAVKGTLTFYRDIARDEKKDVYQDPGGLLKWSNPIILDGVGSVPKLIYYADDELYYLELRDENGQLIATFEHYPIAGGGGGHIVTTEVDYDNQLSNGQFRFQNAKAFTVFSASSAHNIAQSWYFLKDNITGTDEVTFEEFLPGTPPAAIEANPKYYLKYDCSVAATGEALKTIYQPIADVRQFEGKIITFALVARSNTTSTISIDFAQNFGTGGAPSSLVITPIGSQALTTTFTKYYFTATIPSIGGKTIGIDNNDEVQLRINLPLDQLSNVELTNCQFTLTDKQLEYQNKTTFKDVGESLSGILTQRNSYWENLNILKREDVEYLTLTRNADYPNWSPNSFELAANPPVGTILQNSVSTPPPGFLLCDKSVILTSKYPRLFGVLGTSETTPANRLTTATAVPPLVTVTLASNGVVTDAVDVDTGFTITVTQQGTSTLPEIFTIGCTAGSTLKSGAYFNFNTLTPNDTAESIQIILDYNYLNLPTIAGRRVAYVYINSTDDASTVAEKIRTVLDPYAFQTPNLPEPQPEGSIIDINHVPVNPGLGYNKFDVVTLVGGNNAATATIAYVDNFGRVEEMFEVPNSGGNNYPTGVANYNTTGGSGSGLIVRATASGNTINTWSIIKY